MENQKDTSWKVLLFLLISLLLLFCEGAGGVWPVSGPNYRLCQSSQAAAAAAALIVLLLLTVPPFTLATF